MTALALLIKWHGSLKTGGLLRIETPDIAGSARVLVSPKSSWKTKIGAVRHLAGDQADTWAYHLDHWFPERFERTLQPLGFGSIEIQTSSWPHEPYLANVEVTARKRSLDTDEQLRAADALLWESAVAEAERPTFEIWSRQLRALLTGAVLPGPGNVLNPNISGIRAGQCVPAKSERGLAGAISRFFHRSTAASTVAPERIVAQSERATRNGHPGFVIWFTGLSGAGKSTLATGLERALFDLGHASYVLDGDRLRTGLTRDLGFSMTDRSENIRRTGEVSKILADAGMIAIVALISPMQADRDRVRETLPAGHFIEVFANSSLETCERRDVKGLYAKARAGLLRDFTGITSPYEPPVKAEMELRTDLMSVEQCLERLVDELAQRKLLKH